MNYFSYLLDASKWGGDGGTGQLLLQHLAYTAAAVAIGAVVAIPLGILIGHTGRGGFLVIGLSNAARAIPSIGLLVLVVLLTGTGFGPTVLVLAVLALPAILTATAAGVAGADPDAVVRRPGDGHDRRAGRRSGRVAARGAAGDLRAPQRHAAGRGHRDRRAPSPPAEGWASS